MTLMTGLRHGERLAGLVGLSGYLPLAAKTDAERHAANRETPIFLAHGTQRSDDPDRARAPVARRAGRARPAVEWHEYPMPHSVCAAEIADLESLAAARAGPDAQRAEPGDDTLQQRAVRPTSRRPPAAARRRRRSQRAVGTSAELAGCDRAQDGTDVEHRQATAPAMTSRTNKRLIEMERNLNLRMMFPRVTSRRSAADAGHCRNARSPRSAPECAPRAHKFTLLPDKPAPASPGGGRLPGR